MFDEHGAAASADAIDPHAIGDQHTKWETHRAGKSDEKKLETERSDVLAFQQKVDAAHDRVSEGTVSKTDLDALEADLKANAPPSVRRALGHATPADDADVTRRNAALSLTPEMVTSAGSRKGVLPEFAPR